MVMAIYDQELYQLPNESLIEYYKRLAALRGGSVLGTQAMMDIPSPVSSQQQTARPVAGQEVVRPLTDAQIRAQAERDSGMSESERNAMAERDTPEKAAARKEDILQRQIKIALGDADPNYLDTASSAVGFGSPLFGLAALGLGGFADKFERDAAALELGRRNGIEDIERAKEYGYALLENPDVLRGRLESGNIFGQGSSVAQGLLSPQPKQKSLIENLFGINLFGSGDSEPATPAPVYTSLAQANAPFNYDNYGGMFTDYSQTPAQKAATQAVAQASQDAAYEAMGGGYTTPSSSDSGSSPSGGGTPLSEIQGTTDYRDSMGYSSDTSGGWGGWGW